MKSGAGVEVGLTTLLDGERTWFRTDRAGLTILFAYGFPFSSHGFATIIGSD